MRKPSTPFLQTLFCLVLFGTLFSACAQGSPEERDEDAGTDQGSAPDSGMDMGVDAGPMTGLCQECVADDQCPEGSECVPFGEASLCLERVANEFAVCPRTFAAADLATRPGRYYCVPTEGCCIDEDDDNYGQGVFCDGPDCNDDDELVHPDADELCNGDDDDCDTLVDNMAIDCVQQGCNFNGTRYESSPGAACTNGTCEQVTITSCGRYTCIGGGANGDVCAGSCEVGGVDRDDYCIPSAHCDAGQCVDDFPNGSGCTVDSDCASDHCEAIDGAPMPGERPGVCCTSGQCCNADRHCPGFPGAGLLCTDAPTCQGTIGTVTCGASFQCESVNGAPDDAGCTNSIEASNCGPYPSVYCAGTSAQTAPPCATSCNVDAECDANAHCDNNLCVLDLPNGNACDENSDCTSSHCQNGFCCSGGDCCALPSQCPASYSSASVCTDAATCQGTRSDATCIGNVCGTMAGIQDDSGCGTMTVADTCASFPSVFCNGMQTQTRPPCGSTCTLDSQCDVGSHCDSVCIPDIPDGGVCDEDSDCIAGHCQNGYCCASGVCCSTAANCPASFRSASTCGNTTTCQGTRSDATCTMSQCGTIAGVPDDSGCNMSSVSSNCGTYPSVTCNGAVDQTAPVCATSCTVDGDCDANAHCDNGQCLLDVANGEVCDEDSDCTAGHCQNGYCCASGDCCATATNCPASYRSASTCNSVTTCQGTRTDATCTSNQCGTTAPIDDDRGCAGGLMALDCGLNPPQYCSGTETQVPPVCSAACTLDSECIASAHCDGTCVADLPNGSSCDEDSDCVAGHCQNGFCCASGDCCSTAVNCPASYSTAPVCNTAATCQGTRSSATCNANSQCGTISGVEDDSACDNLVVANTCGFFPSVSCNGQPVQAPPTCGTGCSTDADCDANAHCDGGVCLPDLTDGNSCDEASDCVSGHCQNDRCCASGDCCATASNCPASYRSAAVCDDAATCQGSRSDAVCAGNICGTTPNVPDDTACNAGVLASACGPYPSRFCNGLASQVAPVCGNSCSGNGDCDVDAHCSGGLCVPDLADGGSCAGLGAAACASGICNNGFCCSGGTCCSTATDCPAAFRRSPSCDNAATCQGTRDDAACVASSCTTVQNVPDDTACSAATVANTCGPYPSVFCNGSATQSAPVCGAMCTADGDCDANAHCDSNLCTPDLADGSTCDELSDCISGHCNNNRCCSGGVCCSSAAECPAMFTVAPVCDTASSCDGHRNDAVCSGFVCSTSPEIDDDSACGVGTLANACGTYADRFCNGSVSQSAPACGTSCTNDSQCDSSANCMGGMCVSDGANGDACSANNQCMSNHCQNGFCCATGDCCSTASDCGGYGSAPACDSPSTCQGTRDDAVCTAAKQCSTTPNVPDDSACTSGTLANGCGFYTNLNCNGAVSQTAPMCPSSCTNSSQCDAGAFCGMGICQPLRTQGQTCAITSDCVGGLACTDGVCCNSSCSGLCEACNVAGNVGTCSPIPAGQDPASECGARSCAGWYSGWGGTNADQCFTAQNAPATAVDCNGARACETEAQVCPAQPPSTMELDCDNLCQAKNTATCVNQVAPVCTSVTPSPATQTCNQGVCTETLARCSSGMPVSCPSPTLHPNYNPNDTCDGLDNDCDGMVDDGAVALCNLPNANESCGGMAGCQVASCTGGYLNANTLHPDGCECLPESISVNTCASATSAAIQYNLSEGMMGTVTGNLDLMNDEDWYRIVMTNSATQGYRPQVSFTGTVSSDVVFDIYQDNCTLLAPHTGRAGTSCLGTSGQPRNITQYDMNANELTTECAPIGVNGTACNSAPTRTFFIRVHRAQGVAPTCTPYTLQLRNGI